ncbi:hypothetical protein V495_05208 [Pseudogymnoascus sp. VKM F-4514 (FW-929)]|nr:hypothetical protein V495_05208 [Pseudogymnoascus sp. VKM F-4514 (FW-929)]
MEGSPSLANPPATVRRDKQGIPIPPSEYELNDIRPSPAAPLPSARDVPPNDVERSTPPTPTTSTGVDLLQTFTNPPMNKYRMASSTFMNFANGVNDSAPGALIPYLEAAYNVNYAVVSLIFISNALGFIVAAPLTHAIESRLGRARTHQLALSMLALADVALLCAPPFPVIVLSFFFLGFGMAVSLSLNNVFCVGLANATAALGFLHGAYGVGGTIGPLIATALASNGVKWSYFYSIPLFFALSNITAATFAYRNYEADVPAAQLMTALEQTASRQQTNTPTRMQTLKLAARNKTTILGALFIFAYQATATERPGRSVTSAPVSGWASHWADLADTGHFFAPLLRAEFNSEYVGQTVFLGKGDQAATPHFPVAAGRATGREDLRCAAGGVLARAAGGILVGSQHHRKRSCDFAGWSAAGAGIPVCSSGV